MKVPFYAPRDVNATYENNNYTWVDLKVFLNVISGKVLEDFEWLSAFHLDDLEKKEYKDKLNKYAPVAIWDNFVEFGQFLIASKVLFTTWFVAEYWLWEKWTWTHHWIDLILPKNTPIESFSSWKVVRIKKWDGIKKNEWNAVVIESKINNEVLYFCYEHLEEIKVQLNQEVKKQDIIWTCGSTWNSTTNHLHFQIDKQNVPFHPYWWATDDVEIIENCCIDPWTWLIENYEKEENSSNTNNISNTMFAIEDKIKNFTGVLESPKPLKIAAKELYPNIAKLPVISISK